MKSSQEQDSFECNANITMTTAQLRILESFESLLIDVSQKLVGLEKHIADLNSKTLSVQSEVLQINQNIRLIDGKIDKISGKSLDGPSFPGDAEKKLNNFSDLSCRCSSEQTFGVPVIQPLMYEGCNGNSLPTHATRNLSASPEFERIVIPNTAPRRTRSYRRPSIQLTADEANKRARIQRIHSRLLLLNPKKITIDYVRKHLGHHNLRRILWKDFLRIIFGIEEGQPERGFEGSNLIHPSSNFNTYFETVCVLLLICTVVIVPLQLSFWNSNDICVAGGLLYFNMAVDAFFVFDLFYRFFVGVMLPGGIYVHDLPTVAQVYLRAPGGFWFNLVTSIPFGWVDWAFELAYCSGGDMSGNNYAQRMAFARAVKPIRALKLIRLLRVSAIWGNLLIQLDLPPIFFRAFKTVCLILITLHISACGYWRLKVQRERARHGRGTRARTSTAAVPEHAQNGPPDPADALPVQMLPPERPAGAGPLK